jgi:hypothetical protein
MVAEGLLIKAVLYISYHANFLAHVIHSSVNNVQHRASIWSILPDITIGANM